MVGGEGMNKYRNIKTTVDGIRFDSKREAERYSELKLLERAGIITDLKLQPKFELIPKHNGNRALTYIADFSYTEGGEKIVEDVKGMETKEFKIKKKLFEYFYPELKLKIVR